MRRASRGRGLSYPEAVKGLSRAPAPIYLLIGDQPLLADEFVEEAVALIPPGSRDFNISRFVGGEAGGAEIATAAATLPFLSERRLVIVREAQAIADSEALAQYLKDPSPTTVVVFISHHPDFRKRFFSLLSGHAVECSFFPSEIGRWTRERGARLGLDLTPDAIQYLLDYAGGDLYRILRELEKAAVYLESFEGALKRSGPLTRVAAAQISAVCSGSSAGVFDWVDAIFDQNLDRAITLLGRLVRDEEPLHLLALLARHLRFLIRAQAIIDRGGSRQEAFPRHELPRDRFDRFFDQARRFPPVRTRRLLSLLLEVDGGIKGGEIEPPLLLEALTREMIDPKSRIVPRILLGRG